MEENTGSENALANEKEQSFIAKVIKTAAYPVAIAAGLEVSIRELHTQVVNKIKKIDGNPVFGPIKERFSPRYVENALKRKAGSITEAEFFANNHKITTEHGEAMGKCMEEMGFGKRENWLSVKNLSNKLNYINNGKKHKIIFEGLAVAGITVGVLLTMVDNKWLSDRLSGNKDNNDKTR